MFLKNDIYYISDFSIYFEKEKDLYTEMAAKNILQLYLCDVYDDKVKFTKSYVGSLYNVDAVRNDLYTKPGTFELNILLADEVTETAPYNILVRVSEHDEVFIKRNSRNIASTIAGRLGSWKFPFVSVKPDMLLEKPGDFEIELEKGGSFDD